jgi:DNA-binding LacI/PurR family transcriptional regulator/DNA-binding transcriptional regulator YhcF (GntR family)
MNRIGRGRRQRLQNSVLADVRQQIVSGVYAPGQRVPDRQTLGRQFGTSSFTVHKALTELEVQGFVEARGRRQGTFVKLDPPHLTHYGLVFPFLAHSETGIWSRFWSALINEAQNMQRQTKDQERPRRFSFFQGIDGHTDSEDYQQLCRLIEQQRLAGLIFATVPSVLLQTPAMTAPGLPRVALMDKPYLSGIHGVGADNYELMSRAMEHCRNRGRTRVALLTHAANGAYLTNEVMPLAALRGVEVRPYWVQHVDTRSPEWGEQAAHLLFKLDPSDRPNALIIGDDHLVEAGLAGVRAAGVRAGEDVEIVVMAQFPWSPQPMVPVTRIGWETRKILAACIDCLDAQRRGEPLPVITPVPAVFESEVIGNGAT